MPRAAALGVGVVAEQSGGGPQVGEQPARPPRVLGRHHGHGTEHLHGPDGEIPEIAERRGDDVEVPWHPSAAFPPVPGPATLPASQPEQRGQRRRDVRDVRGALLNAGQDAAPEPEQRHLLVVAPAAPVVRAAGGRVGQPVRLQHVVEIAAPGRMERVDRAGARFPPRAGASTRYRSAPRARRGRHRTADCATRSASSTGIFRAASAADSDTSGAARDRRPTRRRRPARIAPTAPFARRYR